MTSGNTDAWSVALGLFAGALPWLVRSAFDIIYVEFRRARNVRAAIYADVTSIASAARLLKQREFLLALAEKDSTEIKNLSSIALLRAPHSDTDPLAKFRPDFYSLSRSEVEAISIFYRKVLSLRLMLGLISDYLKTDQEKAFNLGSSTLTLFDDAAKDAKLLLPKLQNNKQSFIDRLFFKEVQIAGGAS